MDCLENCRFKREAYRYEKECEKLKKSIESGRFERAIEQERRGKWNAQDEVARLKKKLAEKEQQNQKYLEKIEDYKDRLVWAEEDRQKGEKKAKEKIAALKKENGELKKKISDIQWETEKREKDLKKQHDKEMQEVKAAYEKKISALKNEVGLREETIKQLTEHLQGTVDQGQHTKSGNRPAGSKKANSTNSSVPPGMDPNHPTIPNNREPSEKKPGGQPGHVPHPRKDPKADDTIILPPPPIVQANPDEWYYIGETRKKLIRFYMGVEVIEYVAGKYRNHKTREKTHSDFPENVGHLETNYDFSVDAIVAFLHSVCNVPYDKVQEFLDEGTRGKVGKISTGKLASLEKQFSELSEQERAEIAENLFRGKTMNVDGTSIRVNGKLRQILVMCDKKNVLYRMTGCKGDEAVKGTPAENYQGTTITDSESTFTKLGKQNQRCVVHEGRYLNRAKEDTPGLEWPREMKKLMGDLQHRRNVGREREETCMKEGERKKIYAEYDAILSKGVTEYFSCCPRLFEKHLVLAEKRLAGVAAQYGLDIANLPHPGRGKTLSDEELCPEMTTDAVKNLVKDINMLFRFMEAKDSYLLFLKDYSITPHNNDAEKAARETKTHVKPNGGMRSEEYAGYYADTASVLGTEQRNDRSRFAKLEEVFSRGVKAVRDKMSQAVEKRIEGLQNMKVQPEGN